MAQSVIIEVLKIAVPAIASSGLVAFYFSKRLKRIASYEATTNRILNKMLQGCEQIITGVKAVHESTEKLKTYLLQEQVNIDDLIKIEKEIRIRFAEIRGSIDAHRIYITPLIPLGESSNYYNSFTALVLSLQRLIKWHNSKDNSKTLECKNQLKSTIANYDDQYKEFCQRVSRIMKDINLGKEIF